ncbi:hypothetical protein CcI156_19305 [Frankia sp. CcI156]|jgi:DNA invertase Pin-like site-specific DNA recombinase|uniref:Transposase IS3/IS911 n=1 Tax=Frankia casuarinae (strain DSM 45818 / CECT 9043 / HFP020203 / CcI3) TaxID=106370 RepID=Q2J9E9_FRACC|nr:MULTISPECIES: transposase [Frankia]ABD12093.1 transposase IS3/IS911 [Frankia casuarinae]ETA00605.1 hypothetical protein CcI6DRAFT_03995 [Frankia sp. CcI6]EYT91865.1 hypothetical protein ThrDRAFT_02510 [Frankia casuarinae]KDA41315.1 hypothetical protein BMG523Draft_03858 [Frankia sp. BMG5.23]OAA20547.1 transposase [Frankia casuarinae]
MGATRRGFTEEYKEQAVAFVIDGSRPVAEVARNIGVHEMTLGKWVKKAKDVESGDRHWLRRLGWARDLPVMTVFAPACPTWSATTRRSRT